MINKLEIPDGSYTETFILTIGSYTETFILTIRMTVDNT